MTVEDTETPELRALAERARRRWKRWLLIIGASGLVGGLPIGIAAGRSGHRHHAQFHASFIIAALVLAAVILLAEVVLFYWIFRLRKGLFQPTLATGLPWRERRTVMKAVRHGRPLPDALLRTVGRQLAERMLRYRRLAQASYLLLVLMQMGNSLVPDRPSWFRYLCATSAIVFLGALFYHRVLIAGARRYVERCADRPPQA